MAEQIHKDHIHKNLNQHKFVSHKNSEYTCPIHSQIRQIGLGNTVTADVKSDA